MIAPLSERQRAFIDGKVVVASMSGGKDSTALSLWLHENEIEHRRVHALTGWDHRETLDYLRGPLTDALGEIDEVSGGEGMAAMLRRKGMFPNGRFQFCSQELKLKPLARYFRDIQDRCGEVVNAVGIRADESVDRAEMGEREWSDALDCDAWRPLLRWTEADVIAIHQRHGLAPNPLYLKGASRVGCWPCVRANKAQIRMMAEMSPERVAEIRDLERILTEEARKRDPEAGPRTFFKAGPIDEVVAWSKTSHGGRQFELLTGGEPGCVRWGLCEAGGAE